MTGLEFLAVGVAAFASIVTVGSAIDGFVKGKMFLAYAMSALCALNTANLVSLILKLAEKTHA